MTGESTYNIVVTYRTDAGGGTETFTAVSWSYEGTPPWALKVIKAGTPDTWIPLASIKKLTVEIST